MFSILRVMKQILYTHVHVHTMNMHFCIEFYTAGIMFHKTLFFLHVVVNSCCRMIAWDCFHNVYVCSSPDPEL